MAQITFNIPDDKEQRFLNAFADVYAWSNDLGITKRQFFKLKIRDHMREILFRSEISHIDRASKKTLQGDIDSIDVS